MYDDWDDDWEESEPVEWWRVVRPKLYARDRNICKRRPDNTPWAIWYRHTMRTLRTFGTTPIHSVAFQPTFDHEPGNLATVE